MITQGIQDWYLY